MAVSRVAGCYVSVYHRSYPGVPSGVHRLSFATTAAGADRQCGTTTEQRQTGEPRDTPRPIAAGDGERASVVGSRHRLGLDPCLLVDHLGEGDDRGYSFLVGDFALLQETPAFLERGLVDLRGVEPVVLGDLGGRRSVGNVVLVVSGDRLRDQLGLDQRITVLVDHLLPDGRDFRGDVDPAGVVAVGRLTEVAFGVLDEVDVLVRYGALVGDGRATVLLPETGVDPVGGGEDRGVGLIRRFAEDILVVTGEVERLIVGGVLIDHLSRGAELTPSAERRLREPGSLIDVGRRGAVLRTVLRERVDTGRVNHLAVALLAPPAERGLREPSGGTRIGGNRSVLGTPLLEGSDVLLGLDLLRSTVLAPAVERRLREPGGLRLVSRGTAVAGAVFRGRIHTGLVDHLALVHLRVPGGVHVGCPVAVVVLGDDRLGLDIAAVGVATGVGRGPVGPRTVIRPARVVHRVRVVLDRDVRTAVDAQGDVARPQNAVRRTAGAPDDVDDHVGDLVPARGLNPVTGDRLSIDPGGSARHEVVALNLLDLLLVLDPGTGPEAILRLGLLVLVLLMRLLLLTGIGPREAVLIVSFALLARIGPREGVLLVGLLLLTGIGPREAVLIVSDSLEARDEARVLPLVVGDRVGPLDGAEVLRQLPIDGFLLVDVPRPDFLAVGDGILAGGLVPLQVRGFLVLDYLGRRRRDQALTLVVLGRIVGGGVGGHSHQGDAHAERSPDGHRLSDGLANGTHSSSFYRVKRTTGAHHWGARLSIGKKS